MPREETALTVGCTGEKRGTYSSSWVQPSRIEVQLRRFDDNQTNERPALTEGMYRRWEG
jgi:hypothetical protein